MRNPFAYGEEVSGDYFCNRKEEISQILGDIKSGQNIILYSPRRYGKTSLIKEVLRQAGKDGLVSVYVDLYAILKEDDFVSAYAAAISKVPKGNVEKILNILKSIFKVIRPKVVINSKGQPEFGVELTEDTSLMIEDVAQSVKEYSQRYKKQVAVVFDEFQQIGLLKTSRVEKKLRSILQTHGRNISYIFMGSKKHLMQDMFMNSNRPFYKIGRHFPVDKIEKQKLIDFVINRFSFTEKVIPKKYARKIVELAECHPYYVQHLSSAVWRLTEKKVDEKIIEEALSITLGEEKSAYINLWEQLSLNQKKTLLLLAKSAADNHIYSKKSLQENDITAPAVQKALKSLLKKDIVNKTNGNYEIYDVFLKRWLCV